MLGRCRWNPFLGGVAEKDGEFAGRQSRSEACALKGGQEGGLCSTLVPYVEIFVVILQ